MTINRRWKGILAELRAQGTYRALKPPEGIDLCSNDYLGYAGDSKWNCSGENVIHERAATAARLIRGNHPVWEEVERVLASWHGVESVLMMSSGYAANEGLFSTVIEKKDWVASDRLNHASIIDGLRLNRSERFVYDHCKLDQLETGLRNASSKRSAQQQLFIVTESLFGMDGDIAPLQDIVELAERYEAHLVVDEAHATGCYGQEGSGLVDSYGLRSRVLATMHTGGKALAVHGAYICGSSLLKNLLINKCCHFMFSTALPPYLGKMWCEAIDRVRKDEASRHKLHQMTRLFRNELKERELPIIGTEYIVPVIIGDNTETNRMAEVLLDHGYDIRAIRTPTVPANTARLRISVHADHSLDLLMNIVEVLSGII